jgi:preprotein translocase subunit SecG
MSTLFMVLMLLTAVILILLVLVQRGKGGGLAGALGGMGGQSAFGTKAGDMFTKITIGVASFWIILCVVALGTLQKSDSKMNLSPSGLSEPASDAGAGSAPADAGGAAPVESTE